MAALMYKDDHNKLAYLGRERGCEDFTDILSYLDHSPLRYPTYGTLDFSLSTFISSMEISGPTADRTPRPTFGFTKKMFANMKFKWEGQPIPLSPPMLAIAAAGNDAADNDDAANEDNAAANEAAGSAAEVHSVPHSPPVSPVMEPTPERQPASERPPSPSPTPPAQTFSFEEPLGFGPEPRPAGYVDPDVLEPIIFGPQPRPHDYVDPDFVEPIIFGPQPRHDNYLEPEDIDNIMEDDTTHGGFHVESPVGPMMLLHQQPMLLVGQRTLLY
ncbi:hypothetical protein Tco_1493457 [Tanacetum coccineum]